MPTAHESPVDATDLSTEVRQAEALLKTGALQRAIFNSANFSSIATDAKGRDDRDRQRRRRDRTRRPVRAGRRRRVRHAVRAQAVWRVPAAASAREFEGTGIGLATVRRIMAGTAAASGPKARWTRAPRSLSRSREHRPRKPHFMNDHPTSPLKRILLVEDSARDAELILVFWAVFNEVPGRVRAGECVDS